MKVLLLQPDDVVRNSLCTVLRQLADDVKILEANDGPTAMAHAGEHADLTLLIAEFHMAHAMGLLSSRDTRLTELTARLVVVSFTPCYLELIATMERGARAYLPAMAEQCLMLAALQIVRAGGRYFPPDLLVGSPEDDWQAHPSVLPSLTARQLEVLTHVAAGRSNKCIARELGMSAGTVKVHVTAILKALNVRNRTEAVLWAQRGYRNRRTHQTHASRRQMPSVTRRPSRKYDASG
jgi:DNA-binding NarL/FixJ family response regulator